MKNILVCVSGLTPQIVTETLFCLSKQKKIKIDELYIITTSRGRDVIYGLDEEINKKKGLPQLIVEIRRMCEKYKIKIPLFAYNDTHIIVAKEQSIELPDVRNDKDNQLFPNKVCEFINGITKDKNNTLHCSISGGRKSMSVDMAFALSLFGRENDKLWHVLTHENQEFKHFFPENKSQEKDLELAELPYVKLRSILRNKINIESSKRSKDNKFEKMKYTEIVEFTQKEIKKFSADKLNIDCNRRIIWYGNNDNIKIEPKQIDLYRYFIENNCIYNNPIKIEALKNHFNIDRRTGEEIKNYDDSNIRQLITKLNKNIIIPALSNSDETSLFIINSGAYGSGEYYLEASTNNVIFLE